ncbi:hypothetical protein ABK040_009859 [Willaertia magna]
MNSSNNNGYLETTATSLSSVEIRSYDSQLPLISNTTEDENKVIVEPNVAMDETTNDDTSIAILNKKKKRKRDKFLSVFKKNKKQQKQDYIDVESVFEEKEKTRTENCKEIWQHFSDTILTIEYWEELIYSIFFPVNHEVLVIYLNNIKKTKEIIKKTLHKWPNNYIRTTHYTIFSFLPKNIWEQFHRVSNIYFLILTVIAFIPSVAPYSPWTSVIPFSAILIITAIKDLIEDLHRYRKDLQVNNKKIEVINPKSGKIEKIRTRNIRLGMIVRVNRDQEIPADLLILSTSREDNIAFVETANLDGETNLKTKIAVNSTCDMKDYFNLSKLENTIIEIEPPSERLDKFHGTLDMNNNKIPLQIENLILRGSKLRNTNFIYGAVCYVGKFTKLSLNLEESKSKFSHLDKSMNWLLIKLLLLQQIVIAIFVGLSCYFQTYISLSSFYVKPILSPNITFQFVASQWATYLILLNLIVPMSLFLTLEFIKTFQAKLMEADIDMSYKGVFSQAKTSQLNQELSQIEIIFSDKTGTLTENKMIFSKCFIKSRLYTHHDLKENLNEKDVKEFLTCICVNHSALPEKDDNGMFRYDGPSADEIALLNAAKENQFILKSCTRGGYLIQMNDLKDVYFEKLATLDFTHDRKRMSVIVKENDKITLYIKGADNVIKSRAKKENNFIEIDKQLSLLSMDGLRTLVLAKRELTMDEFNDWYQRYKQAVVSFNEREKLIDELAEEIETNLEIIGCTGIKDELQENVKESIDFFLKANILVFVLTGDKTETAINVGLQAGILNKFSTIQLRIKDCENQEDCLNKMKQIIVYLNGNIGKNRDYSLIIDSKSFSFAFTHYQEQLCTILRFCRSAIGCRLTPLQKAQIVKIVQEKLGKKGLAIGDGVNDVSMIHTALIGVGVMGSEGNQAARASDYAICKFKHLVKLMSCHGRYNYIRNSYYLQTSFYKNMMIVYTQLFFAFFCGFTGTTPYDGWVISMYNTIFTLFIPCYFGIFEKDLLEDDLLSHPELYPSLRRDALFNSGTLSYWFLNALYHSIIIFFFSLSVTDFISSNILGSTVDGGMDCFGTLMMTCIIIVVTIRHSLSIKYWTIITHLAVWLSLVIYFGFIFAYSAVKNLSFLGASTYYWNAYVSFSSVKIWMSLILIVVTSIMPDILFKGIKQSFFKEDWQKILTEKPKLPFYKSFLFKLFISNGNDN